MRAAPRHLPPLLATTLFLPLFPLPSSLFPLPLPGCSQQAGAPLTSDPAALALRARMLRSYRSLRAIRETIVQRQWTSDPQKASTLQITLRFRRPNRVYLNVDYPQIGQPGRWYLTFACDGRTLIFYNSARNEFQRLKAPATLENIQLPASLREPEIVLLLKNVDPFAELDRSGVTRASASFENTGPAAYDILQMDAHQEGADRRLRYRLDPKDHLLRGWSLAIQPDAGPPSPFRAAETAANVTAEYTQVEVDPRLADGDFAFTPPAGAKEVRSPRRKDRP
ncbi:MAG TPA: hypothetical protein VKU00_25775 [Chthonomonadaceae bacterium]|nr:hypothetical protein [Chthonomonadaceae bacterium]